MPAALKSINESPYGESTRHVFHVATSDLLHLLTTYIWYRRDKEMSRRKEHKRERHAKKVFCPPERT